LDLGIDMALARAANALNESRGSAERGMWLDCVAYVEGAIQLLASIDDMVERTHRDLEPDEETRYAAIRRGIHNVLQGAARVGGNGRAGATPEDKKEEFKSLVRYMIAQNSSH